MALQHLRPPQTAEDRRTFGFITMSQPNIDQLLDLACRFINVGEYQKASKIVKMLVNFIEGEVETLRLLILKVICHFGCNEIKDAHHAITKISDLVNRPKFNFKNLRKMEPSIDTNILGLLDHFTKWNKKNCQSVEMIAKCAIKITCACYKESILMEKLVSIADRISKFPGRYSRDILLVVGIEVDPLFYKTSRISLLLKKVVSKLQRIRNIDLEEKSIAVATTFFLYGKNLCEVDEYQKAILPFENAIALLETASITERYDKLIAAAYDELGKAHWNCSRTFEAQKAFQKMRKIRPNSDCCLSAGDIFRAKALTLFAWLFKAISKSLLLLLVIIGVVLAFVIFSDPNLVSSDSASIKLIILTRISNFLFFLSYCVNEAAEDVRANLDL